MTTRSSEQALLLLLAYAGLRRFECTGLRYADVDLEQQQLRVLGKGGKLRRVPIHPHLAAALRSPEHRPDGFVLRNRWGRPMSVNAFDARLRSILKTAGVDGGTRPAHKFRKAVATSLNENGARESVIGQIMGWAP